MSDISEKPYKILVVSDSHGMNKGVRQAVELENPDMLIHCGDVQGFETDIERIAGAPRVPCVFVKGNNDWDSRNPYTRTFKLKGHKFLITHGHTHGVYTNAGVQNLIYLAMENECDIVCFGHTHAVYDEEVSGVRLLNPGSISLPRGTKKKSYMIINMKEDGTYTVEKRFLV
jgi:hypothetical protein